MYRMDFTRFVRFEEFIARDVISIVYFIGAIFVSLMALIMIFSPMGNMSGGTGVLVGIVFFVVGNLIWRIICEGFVVIFTINDTLASINEKLDKKDPIDTTPL
jgi:hypothetical protein